MNGLSFKGLVNLGNGGFSLMHGGGGGMGGGSLVRGDLMVD